MRVHNIRGSKEEEGEHRTWFRHSKNILIFRLLGNPSPIPHIRISYHTYCAGSQTLQKIQVKHISTNSGADCFWCETLFWFWSEVANVVRFKCFFLSLSDILFLIWHVVLDSFFIYVSCQGSFEISFINLWGFWSLIFFLQFSVTVIINPMLLPNFEFSEIWQVLTK